MEIKSDVLEAVRLLGKDTEYLRNESYELASWENLEDLKKGFPTTREGIQLTNGVDIVDPQSIAKGVHSANADDEAYFGGIMQLKASRPDLPVYEIHNHPSVEGYIQAGLFFDDGEEEWKQTQRLASSVPSPGDIRRWNSMHSLVGAGIYVQDSNEVRLFREGDERNKIGTVLAIEHDENNNPLSAYWATEGENEPMTEYIKPEEWQDKKDKWLPYFNKSTFAAPWTK